jgi:hypothetical protein
MKKKLETTIYKKIQKLNPKPKWYFTLYNSIKNIALFTIWILCVSIIGILIYILTHYYNIKSCLSANFVFHNILGFPWEIIVIIVLFCILIFLLARKIYFLYRINSYLLVLFIILSLLLGYYISEKTGINESLSNLKISEAIYSRGGNMIFANKRPMLIAQIIELNYEDNIMLVKDIDNKFWNIIIDRQTQFFPNQQYNTNDIVQIHGIKDNYTIKAQLIKKINRNQRGLKRKLQYHNHHYLKMH